MDEQSVQAKESTEDADCTRWQLWVHIRLTWHRHTVFSHTTRTECGYKVIGISGTEMSPGPLVPSISVLFCSTGSLASLKIPKDLSQMLPTAAELGQLLLVSFIPKKIFTNLHLLIGQNCTPCPHNKFIDGKENTDAMTAPSHPLGKRCARGQSP